MASLNKVLLIGNMTRDPELKYTPSGMAVCEFDIAVNRRWKDKDETTFLSIEAWGKQGEFVKNYFKKGSAIFVEGRIKVDQWEAKDGTKRKRFAVVAENLSFVDSRSGGGAGGGSREKPAGNNVQESFSQQEPGEELAEPHREEGVDDDLPF